MTGPGGTPALLTREELGAWRGFLQAHAELTRALDSELTDAHGLSLSSYEVLLLLVDAPDGRMRMSDLADGVLLSRSGLTRLVDRLERAGLVDRARCTKDARGLYATVTPKGRRAFHESRRTHLDGVRRRFLVRLGDEDVRGLAEVWRRLLEPSTGT